jgi:hypothetical protein
LQLKRQLTGVLLIEFNKIGGIINQHSLSLTKDKLIWRWNSSGGFSTHLVSEWLMFHRVVPDNAELWWDLPVPFKIKSVHVTSDWKFGIKS